MASKKSFTPDEWTKILESTAVTGMAGTPAEPKSQPAIATRRKP